VTVHPPIPLCVRLPNWVGDVCMALPALALLRRAGFALHLVGKGWAADLLAGFPDHVARLPTGLLAGARTCAASGARQALLLTNSFGSALQARLAGLDAVGFARDGRSLLLARAVAPRRGPEVE
jgi:heptosyltransferase-2